MKLNSRFAVVAAIAVGAATLAGATTFSFQTFGATWTPAGVGLFNVAEVMPPSSSFNLQGNVTNVTALDYSIAATPINAISGTAVGRGFFQDATLGMVSFSFSGTYSTTNLANGLAISDASTTYVVVNTGETLKGNISDNLFQVGQPGGVANYEYNTLNAVPEPASIAVFALGAIGLYARRRRS